MGSNVLELLEKINRTLKGAPVSSLSKLEYDLVMQHIRDLYEQLDAARNAEKTEPKQHFMKVEPPVAETLQPEELIIKKAKPAEENILLNDVHEKPEPKVLKPEVKVPEQKVLKAEVKDPEPVKIAAKKEVTTVHASASNKTGEVSLNERVKSAGTLNEKVKVSGEVHHKLGSKHLKDLIDLNKRFVFVNELFKGNSDAFSKAVQHIDTANDFADAEGYIKGDLTEQFEWDEKAQATRLFVKLVKQRFGVE